MLAVAATITRVSFCSLYTRTIGGDDGEQTAVRADDGGALLRDDAGNRRAEVVCRGRAQLEHGAYGVVAADGAWR